MPMTAAVEVIVAAESETARAMPKSITLTVPWGVIITFPGLMSRCTMPLRWLKSSAPQMSAARLIARSGGSGPSRRSTSRRVSPSTYSMTMYGRRAGGGAVLAGVVDGDDRRVVQRGRGLRLAAEADLEGRVAREVAAQHLDGDLAAEPQVAAAVHLGHAAAAEHPADLVALTEHLRRGHRRSSRAVRCVIRARAAESSRRGRPARGPAQLRVRDGADREPNRHGPRFPAADEASARHPDSPVPAAPAPVPVTVRWRLGRGRRLGRSVAPGTGWSVVGSVVGGALVGRLRRRGRRPDVSSSALLLVVSVAALVSVSSAGVGRRLGTT